MKKKIIFLTLISMMSISLLTACKKDTTSVSASDQTVVEYANSDKNFSILVQALTKANLVDALNGSGKFTVFAPTNDAFNAFFKKLGVSGIADLSAEQLIPILKYHVVSGNIRSTQLTAGSVATLNGPIAITLTPAPAINGNTHIVATDVQASNGVIHVIDKVLLPK